MTLDNFYFLKTQLIFIISQLESKNSIWFFSCVSFVHIPQRILNWTVMLFLTKAEESNSRFGCRRKESRLSLSQKYLLPVLHAKWLFI